ncbi:MAG: hypothetical protein ACRYGK_16350 [Janthinobacterium lividum]
MNTLTLVLFAAAAAPLLARFYFLSINAANRYPALESVDKPVQFPVFYNT